MESLIQNLTTKMEQADNRKATDNIGATPKARLRFPKTVLWLMEV